MLSGLERAHHEFASGICSLPLWAREGTSASIQSWKESQLLRRSQKRELVYSLVQHKLVTTAVTLFGASLSLLLFPGLSSHHTLPSLSLHHSHPKGTAYPNYIFPADPRCAASVPKIDISDTVPRLSQLFMEFLMPSCHWLCRIVLPRDAPYSPPVACGVWQFLAQLHWGPSILHSTK